MDAISLLPAEPARPTTAMTGTSDRGRDDDALSAARAEADAAMVSALALDVDAAFPALVDQHQDRLYTIALRMLGDPSEAEEATQDALVRAYRAMTGYDRERLAALRLRGWLATIVLNLCRNRLGRRPRHGSVRSLDDESRGSVEVSAAEEGSPSAVALRRDARDRWAARLLRLPTAYRAAVILRHVDGLTYPEVAAALDRPEGTVKAQVHRGIGLLRSMLEEEAHTENEELSA